MVHLANLNPYDQTVVCYVAFDPGVGAQGREIGNGVREYLLERPNYPRPVHVKVECPIGCLDGLIRISIQVQNSKTLRLISPSHTEEPGWVSWLLAIMFDELKRELTRSVLSDSFVAPSKTPGDLINSIRIPYNSMFEHTCWGKSLSFHPADAVRVVYTSGPVTTLIFKSGEKFQVRKSEKDLLNNEKGLAMVVCKACLEKDTYEMLCKYANMQSVILLAKFLMSPPEYEKLKREKWKIEDGR